MLKKMNFLKKIVKQSSSENDIEVLKKNAIEICDEIFKKKLAHLNTQNYNYDTKQAVEELGLDQEMIDELVDDYVAQVIRAISQFDGYMEKLQDSKDNAKELDYTLFRELAHKNLGVARNLRIKDAEALLYELMKKDDLEYLLTCLEALRVCAIKLRPEVAHKTISSIS
jgi:parvulin-like peptidyl-prolyl isomerase